MRCKKCDSTIKRHPNSGSGWTDKQLCPGCYEEENNA